METAIEEVHEVGIGIGVDGGIGEGGGDAVDDLEARGEVGELGGVGAGEEVEFAGGGLADGFGEHDEAAEAVVPVAEAFGAVAVGVDAFEVVFGIELSAGDEEGAGVAVGDGFEGDAGDAGEADGGPVVVADHPPVGFFLAGVAGDHGVDDAALEVVVDEGAGVGGEFVAEHPVGGGHLPAEGGGAEVDVDLFAGEVEEFAIVGGKEPGGFGAECVGVFGDSGEIAAVVAEAFGEDERVEVAAAFEGDFLPGGAIAFLSEEEEEGVGLVGDGIGVDLVGVGEEFLIAGECGELFPRGAIGDAGAGGGGGIGEPLFDLGDAGWVGEWDGVGGGGGAEADECSCDGADAEAGIDFRRHSVSSYTLKGRARAVLLWVQRRRRVADANDFDPDDRGGGGLTLCLRGFGVDDDFGEFGDAAGGG